MGDPGSSCLYVIGHVYITCVCVFIYDVYTEEYGVSSGNVLSNGDKKGRKEEERERERRKGGEEGKKKRRKEGEPSYPLSVVN